MAPESTSLDLNVAYRAPFLKSVQMTVLNSTPPPPSVSPPGAKQRCLDLIVCFGDRTPKKLAIAQCPFHICLVFWAGVKSPMFWVRAAPGALETFQKGGGPRPPPTFLKGVQAPRGRPDRKNLRFSAGPKIKNNIKIVLSDGKKI